MAGIPGDQFSTSYNILPEEAYCSALDINCDIDGEPRFPWQRDVAIQCDLMPTINTQNIRPSIIATNTQNTNTTLLSLSPGHHPKGDKHEKHENILSGIRFWKSSSILGGGTSPIHQQEVHKKHSAPAQPKRHHKNVLQRAVSFDSRGYQKLEQSLDQQSPPNTSPTSTSSSTKGTHLYVPHHVQTLTPSPEANTPLTPHGPPHSAGSPLPVPLFEHWNNSAPNSCSITPPLTPTINSKPK